MLSVVIISRDQLQQVRELYYHLKDFTICDDILIVDDKSTDWTQKRCEERSINLVSNTQQAKKWLLKWSINTWYRNAKNDTILFAKPGVRFIDDALAKLYQSAQKNRIACPSYFQWWSISEEWEVDKVLTQCFCINRQSGILPIIDSLNLFYIWEYLYNVAKGEVETVWQVRLMPNDHFDKTKYLRDRHQSDYHLIRDANNRDVICKKNWWK